MIGTIIKSNLQVNNREAGHDTCLHCALNTGINSRDILLGYRTG